MKLRLITPDTPLDSEWLENPETRSFRFDDGTDSYTARKEKIRGKDGYWYAYKKIEGKLHKSYIAPTSDLSHKLLIRAGSKLRASREPREKLPKKVGNSEEGLSELGEAREIIRDLQQTAFSREADFDRCIEQKRKLEKDLEELHKQLGNLQATLFDKEVALGDLRTAVEKLKTKNSELDLENERLKAALKTSELEEEHLARKLDKWLSQFPEPAELLNQYKASRPKTKVTLADVEAIIEMLQSDP